MTQLISATFDDAAQGLAAAGALGVRFSDSPIRSITPADVTAGLQASLVRDGHCTADAARHARAIAGGLTYVSIAAGWGQAKSATLILRRAGAKRIESHVPYGEEYGVSEASPLSDTFGLPVLLDSPTPMSKFWGLKVLSNGYSFSRSLGLPTLARNGTLLSSILHLPTLTAIRFFFPTRRTT